MKLLSKILILIIIIKELLLWVVIPLTISHASLVYIEAEGECPDVDVDDIIDEKWSNTMNKIMNDLDETWSKRYLIKPIMYLYKWKGDIQFEVFKWIYHTRSGC